MEHIKKEYLSLSSTFYVIRDIRYEIFSFKTYIEIKDNGRSYLLLFKTIYHLFYYRSNDNLTFGILLQDYIF